MSLTVIYYSSNREDEAFEAKVQMSLVNESGDLPLISVTQKPSTLGLNLCVGDVGVSTHNIRRQFLIGAEAACTKYVCAAEADFLYPKEYFDFRPPTDDRMYFADNLYVMWVRGRKCSYRQKSHSEGAMAVSREFIIKHLTGLLKGRPHLWEDGGSPGLAPLERARGFATFHTDLPLVTIKTKRGMAWACPHSEHSRMEVLPHWGSTEDVKRKYLT